MRQYEITFVIDPVLPKNEIEQKANKYIDMLKKNDCEIVHIDEMGLRQLAYPINRRNSGIYYCVEFKNEYGTAIPELEVAMRRDEELLRFLTVALNKFGVKYNEDKRNGLIGTVKKKSKKEDKGRGGKDDRRRGKQNNNAKAENAAPAKAADSKATTENKVAATPAPAAAEATPAAKDDLKKIEGIGPKIAQLFNEAGITTFAGLAATEVDKMKEILSNAGSRFARHDPSTWGKQAQMAADGKWDELKKWQDELDGGKPAAKASGEEE